MIRLIQEQTRKRLAAKGLVSEDKIKQAMAAIRERLVSFVDRGNP